MRVVHDLREAIDRLLEPRVEAMDEDENLMPRRADNPGVEIRFRLSQVHSIGAQSDEIVLRIAGRRGRQLNIAGLARLVRGDRHDDICEIELSSSRAAEHNPRRLQNRRARCRYEDVNLARARRRRPDDKTAIRSAGAAGDQHREAEKAEGRAPRTPRRRFLDRRAQATRRTPAQPQPPDQSTLKSARP
jgi:hypothetical protein